MDIDNYRYTACIDGCTSYFPSEEARNAFVAEKLGGASTITLGVIHQAGHYTPRITAVSGELPAGNGSGSRLGVRGEIKVVQP